MSTPRARAGAFISYARADGEATARALRDRLAAEVPDVPAWMDRLELEGGVGWWNQIEDQLDRVEFLLLVMSPAAMASENTRREWRAARQRGVCVYPIQAPTVGGTLNYEALPRWMRKAHFYDPDLQWATLVAHLRRGCRATRVPFMAPALPPAYVTRQQEAAALEQQVLGTDACLQPIALRGAGGFGKTSLAAACCHQDSVIEAFDDGILWVTLGQTPKLLTELSKLYAALTGQRPGFVDVDDAAHELAQQLEGKNCLIVIDDVWSAAHLRPFLLATGPVRLITTRVFDVALGCTRIDVDRMSPDEALHLLLARADVAPADVEPYRRLAKRLGDWPLTLKLAGSAIRQRVVRGDTPENAADHVQRSLDRHGITVFDRNQALDSERTVDSTLAPSLALLDEPAQQHYANLSIFAEDKSIPLSAAAALWQLDELDAEDLARRLDDLALAEFDLRRGTLRLHDVLRSLLLSRLPDARAVHQRLAAAWSPTPAAGDSYAWHNLAYHLRAAGRLAELRAHLLDPAWLAAKLAATDVYALIADFDGQSDDPALMLVRDVLRRSAAALAADPQQLPTQLLARLMGRSEPDIVAMLDKLRAHSPGPWLLPLHPSLEMPGGMLALTLLGHEGAVTSLACSHDGTWLLSASEDGTLRIWTSDGAQVQRLMLHRLAVQGLALDAQGRTAVCAVADGRLYGVDLQELARGGQARVLTRLAHEPRRALSAVALSAEGRIAVCGGRGPHLDVWDLVEQRVLLQLRGHGDRINAVALSADASLVVSGSDDGTVRLWELPGGSLLQTLHGHGGAVTCVALSPGATRGGGTVVSGSSDRSLRVWDVGSGACVARLLGHEAAITCVDISADGQQVLSGASNRMLNLWQLPQGRLLRQTKAHGDALRAVRFAPTPGLAISASADRSIKLWQLSAPEPSAQDERHDEGVNALAFSPDGRLCASGGLEGRIKLWDVATGRCVASMGRIPLPVLTLAFTPDASCVVAGVAGGQFNLWLIETQDSVWASVRHSAPVSHCTYSHNARYLITACSDHFIYRWDVSSSTLLTRYGTRRLFDHLIRPSSKRQHLPPSEELLDTYLPGEPVFQVTSLAIDDQGRHAAIAGLPVHAGSMRSDSLAVEERDASVVVLNLQTGALSTVPTGQDLPVERFAVDPSGRHVAWAAPDHSLKFWDCERDQQTARAVGHRDRVQALAVAPEAGLVVSCAMDRSVRVWRLDSGASVAALIGDSPMRTLQLAPDQRVVAAGDAQGRVHFLSLV